MTTVLLVDDSPTILTAIGAILERASFEVLKASHAAPALDHLAADKKVHLMITDLNMPGMDGITLVRETRKLAPRRFMPILLLTTESQVEKRQEAKAAGATGWLVKPVEGRELLDVVKRLVPGA
jgi:two-component system chemotaxis response regulator CheY